MSIMTFYRVEHWLYNHHLNPIALALKGCARIVWGTVLPPSAKIGKGTFITYHGLGVVLHKDAVIGEGCIIRQNVTIAGGKRNGVIGAPVIGDRVEINTGAVIVGPVRIGNNVRIGANSFVNTDIPDNCTAVGLPAKPVKFVDPDTFSIHI